jgi:hypothetical protein
MKRAERAGTLLTHAGDVRFVLINGAGQLACVAANILCTKIGMKKNGKWKTENGKSLF